MSWIFISILFWPVVLIFVIVLIIFLLRRKKKSVISDNNWYLHISLGREDILSQIFFSLSLAFLFLTLLAINRDFGLDIRWYWILLLVSGVGLYIAYKFKSVLVLVFSLLGLVSWWNAKSVEWVSQYELKTIYVFAGMSFIFLIFYLIGKWSFKIVKYKRFYFVYVVLSLIYMIGSFFVFSTKGGLNIFEDLTKGFYLISSWEMYLSLSVLFVLFVALMMRTFKMKIISKYELIFLVCFAGFVVLASVLPGQTLSEGYWSLSNAGIFWAVFFNVSVFVMLLSVVFLGYNQREIWMINLGAKSVFILVIIKYFDWFFEFIDKSIFFLGAGALMLALGWSMEKGRKYIITNVKKNVNI